MVEVISKIIKKFRAEHLAFKLTCLYVIFEYNRPHQIWPIIDVIPWGKTLLGLGLLLSMTDVRSKRYDKEISLPIILFSVAVAVSTLFAHYPDTSIDNLTMFFGWVLAMLLISRVITTKDRFLLFMVVYFLVNFKMAQHGFRSWATRGFSFSGWGVSGSPGWFQNSGEFSLEMVMFVPLIVSYFLYFKNEMSISSKLIMITALMVSIASVVASSSRGGLLGLGILCIWFLALYGMKFKTIMMLVVAVFTVYLVLPVEFKARFDTAGEDSTSTARLTYWKYGMDAIQNNSFTGIGFRNWTRWIAQEHPEVIGIAGGKTSAEVIHNSYLEATTELGVPGGLIYIAVLGHILILNIRSVKIAKAINDKFLLASAVGLVGSLLGFLVPSYFMAVLYYPYVWMLLAMSYCLYKVCQAPNP